MTMPIPTSVALAVLIASLITMWLLGKAKLVGSLTLVGFVLGSLATASAFVLLG
jgi:hypothetical protein